MNEQSIAAAALARLTAAERTEYLDAACGEDGDLRQRVESLLQAQEQAVSDSSASPDVTAALDSSTDVKDANPAPPDLPKPMETTAEPSPAQADADLAFLQPSNRPDALGRLAHYEVLQVLGKGGFGIVLKAFDEKLHRLVAIKLLGSQLSGNDTARKRFVREARAAAAVRDEHVVKVYDVEESPRPYLVMEYVAGQTLQDQIDQTGPPDVLTIVRLGMEIASGLAAAHRQGEVHRDIKPANILVEQETQRAKITDFGLARAVDDASLTQSGVIAGTPLFMSPEQARGESVDHRSDLFSLGSVLYTLCTGKPPFRAAKTLGVLKRVCDDTPEPIRDLNPDIPDTLSRIIDKLMVKERELRFQTAAEVAGLLEHYLAHLRDPLATPSPVLPAFATSEVVRPTKQTDNPEQARQVRSARRGRWQWIAVVALAAIPVGVVGFYAYALLASPPERRTESPPANTPPTVAQPPTPSNPVPAPAELRGLFQQGETAIRQGNVSGAIAVCREIIKRDPNNAQAHLLLGVSLALLGNLDEAVPTLRRAVELDPGNDKAKQFLAELEPLHAIVNKLPQFLKGEFTPRTNQERLILATLCQKKHFNRAAAGLYADAFAQDLELTANPMQPRRYNAACCAALAGAGKGEDAAGLDDAEKARLRKQAVDWLRADLDLIDKRSKSAHPDPPEQLLALVQHWQKDPDLVGIREEPGLGTLPEPERQACQKLWADVEARLNAIQARQERDAKVLTAVKDGRWPEVKALLAKSLETTPDDHDTWCHAATVAAYLGDDAEYARCRTQLLERFGATDDPMVAERTAKACLLLAPEMAELKSTERLVELAVAKAEEATWIRPYAQFARGLTTYRQGKYELAEEMVNKAIAAKRNDWVVAIPAQLVLAMSQQQRGLAREGRESLTQAIALLDQELPDPAGSRVAGNWKDWLSCQVLRREAEALIERTREGTKN